MTLAAPYAAYIARLARAGHARGAAAGLRAHRAREGAARSAPSCSTTRCAARCCPVVSFLGARRRRDPDRLLRGRDALRRCPGMGQWFVKGAINRDYSLVLGTALVYAALVAALNLAADLALRVARPARAGRAMSAPGRLTAAAVERAPAAERLRAPARAIRACARRRGAPRGDRRRLRAAARWLLGLDPLATDAGAPPSAALGARTGSAPTPSGATSSRASSSAGRTSLARRARGDRGLGGDRHALRRASPATTAGASTS